MGGTTGLLPSDEDCNGDLGGGAYYDSCNECVSGASSLPPCLQDCNGTWGGTAQYDICGSCAGGDTGRDACQSDCNGIWGGPSAEDLCGVCDANPGNDNTSCGYDCNGVPGGPATADDCGVCDGNPDNNNSECGQDCMGEWGGDVGADLCGICDDDVSNDNTTCTQDCLGNWNGGAFIDNCNRCVGPGTIDMQNGGEKVACERDCSWVWGGSAFYDDCGFCVGGQTGADSCGQDCNGDFGGLAEPKTCHGAELCVGGNSAFYSCGDGLGEDGCPRHVDASILADSCGNCVVTGVAELAGVGGFIEEACGQDCLGVWGGGAYMDECGVCDADPANDNTVKPDGTVCEQDCLGHWGGNVNQDDCGTCDADPNNDNTSCEQDCGGVWDGGAQQDDCGECWPVGTNMNQADNANINSICEQDCNAEWDGEAYEDDCGICVFGSTGLEECTEDCWGDLPTDLPNGVSPAEVDGCGQCVGGQTEQLAVNPDTGMVEVVASPRPACAPDCNGDFNPDPSHAAQWDPNCTDLCIYGDTGEVPCLQDCNNVWGGLADTDFCGECTDTPCEQDCEGNWGGPAHRDDCGICDQDPENNNTVHADGSECVADCAGRYGGIAYADDCGVCNSDRNDDNTVLPDPDDHTVATADVCERDCSGVWAGLALGDNCGVCQPAGTDMADDTVVNTTCVQDCNGDWNGYAFVDLCGECAGGNSGVEHCNANCPVGDPECVRDCKNRWGGDSYVDDCGVCDEERTNDNATCAQDCDGVWAGIASFDQCGICDGNPENDNSTCAQDCNAVWGGIARVDRCGTCAGGDTGAIGCAQDCNNEWGGSASIEPCDDSGTTVDRCIGGTTGNFACGNDCADVPNGLAFVDQCGDCTGGTTGVEPCQQDCLGEWGGEAWEDECGRCVGGNTLEEACIQDCNGEWGGIAFTDLCEECVGGSTGNWPCRADCNGDFGGLAGMADCYGTPVCLNGNTGVDSCIPPCFNDDGTEGVRDCNGVCGGEAQIDMCGFCDLDSTNDCSRDCFGAWGGSAYRDSCGHCDGDPENDCRVLAVVDIHGASVAGQQIIGTPEDMEILGDAAYLTAIGYEDATGHLVRVEKIQSDPQNAMIGGLAQAILPDLDACDEIDPVDDSVLCRFPPEWTSTYQLPAAGCDADDADGNTPCRLDYCGQENACDEGFVCKINEDDNATDNANEAHCYPARTYSNMAGLQFGYLDADGRPKPVGAPDPENPGELIEYAPGDEAFAFVADGYTGLQLFKIIDQAPYMEHIMMNTDENLSRDRHIGSDELLAFMDEQGLSESELYEYTADPLADPPRPEIPPIDFFMGLDIALVPPVEAAAGEEENLAHALLAWEDLKVGGDREKGVGVECGLQSIVIPRNEQDEAGALEVGYVRELKAAEKDPQTGEPLEPICQGPIWHMTTTLDFKYMYMSQGEAGISIWDVHTNPTKPTLVNRIEVKPPRTDEAGAPLDYTEEEMLGQPFLFPAPDADMSHDAETGEPPMGEANGTFIGPFGYVYVAAGRYGLQIFDIGHPDTPDYDPVNPKWVAYKQITYASHVLHHPAGEDESGFGGAKALLVGDEYNGLRIVDVQALRREGEPEPPPPDVPEDQLEYVPERPTEVVDHGLLFMDFNTPNERAHAWHTALDPDGVHAYVADSRSLQILYLGEGPDDIPAATQAAIDAAENERVDRLERQLQETQGAIVEAELEIYLTERETQLETERITQLCNENPEDPECEGRL